MQKISSVEPISIPPCEVTDIDQLDFLAEAPVLAACRRLFELKIRTFMSSANCVDATERNPAWIMIEYFSLSPENQRVAERIGRLAANHRYMVITVDLDPAVTVEAVSSAFMKVVDRFVVQEALPPLALTLESMRDIYELVFKKDASALGVAFFEASGNYLYDPEAKIFRPCLTIEDFVA